MENIEKGIEQQQMEKSKHELKVKQFLRKKNMDATVSPQEEKTTCSTSNNR